MIATILFAAALAQQPEVVAVVDKIDRTGVLVRRQGGDPVVFPSVELSIVSPAKYATRHVEVYGPGILYLGDRPLMVGNRLTFRLPEQQSGTLWWQELKELRREGTPLSPAIPYEEAKRVFDEAQLASDEDFGKLWGVPLYGPLVFADPKTRTYVRQNGTGGQLPAGVVVANTATKIDDELTTMISWPAINGGPPTAQRRLAMHECFHRIQAGIGFPANSPSNPHLDTVDGRYWLQLELRALAAALRATGDARTSAIRDAVAFRAARREAFAGAAETERALENNEGLAEYTGWALRGTSPEESRLTFARHLDRIDPATSFVRGFAYETGPAYGLLLDVLTPGWTHKYKVTDDLSKVAGIAGGNPNPEAYGGAELRSSEEKRDREQRERVARFRARLVDGPVLELPLENANYGFDPNGVTALGDAGNGYESLEITGPWGRISIEAGARIAKDWNTAYAPAEDRSKLQLQPGWKVVTGSRQGDLRVIRE